MDGYLGGRAGYGNTVLTFVCRFVGAEQWRKETKLDELLPTWEYPEKEKIFEFYPQYYHKTDKVSLSCRRATSQACGTSRI